MSKFFIYPTPQEALCQIQHDNTWTADLHSDIAPDGRIGQSVEVPNDVPTGWGARLVISAKDKITFSNRGFFVKEGDHWRLQIDDITLADAPKPPIPPDPEPNPPDDTMPIDPHGIVNWTFAHGHYNLQTKEGCGKFTEDCCTNLHESHSAAWGHIKKNPGQNQYNGHAVDAVYLLVPNPDGTAAGIYDIIFSTESPDAKPAFNYSGPGDPNAWYYPANPVK